MSRGNALELGIRHAGAHYRTLRRAAVLKQEPRRKWDGTIVGKAPVDFLGVRTGVGALALEAKETADDRFDILDETHMAPSQITTCNELHACGTEVWLIVDFTACGEVYACPWAQVAKFLAAPWRSSLSLDWCRAYGLLLPEEFRGDDKRRRTLFLDGVRHSEAFLSLAHVMEERAAHDEATAAGSAPPERSPRTTKRQLELAARTAARPNPRDREAYLEYLRGVTAESIERQAVARIDENKKARAMAARRDRGGRR